MPATLIFLLEPCAIEGQVYMKCGSACPPTCADPGPRICTRQCVQGCQCPSRTVLDETINKCVLLAECTHTKTCPIEGQVYMECGSACPPTCANPNPACIALCVEGCQCPTGTVLDEDANKCVDPDDCNTETCPIEGQVYMECASACPPTCANPNPACIALCVEGCQCPTGTVLDEDANKCVDPDDCNTETCPIEGQVYMECGSACPPTCANPNPACIALCVEGCQCPTGTVLDEDANKCVDPDDCNTETCPIEGQVYMECASACPPTCANPNPACIAQCVEGCQCPAGTVLDEDANKCVVDCTNTCTVDPESGDVHCTDHEGTTTFKSL